MSFATRTHQTASLLEVKNLNVHFQARHGSHHAVKNLDFSISAGETLALVGESGCGKSTTALALLRLLGPEATIHGEINFSGRNILKLSAPELRRLRGHEISMIFQEPMTSLNPVHTIGSQIAETLRLHQGLSKHAAHQRSIEILDLVKIPEPQRRIYDYPHHLSGGQRQRVMIAMAVACQPRLLIADEPTTALDVTVQARILELLDQLRREFSMGLILITHDLGVVSQWADQVLVMLDGEKIEAAPADQFFHQAKHAYAQGLLGASLHSGNDVHYTESRLPEIQRSQGVDTGLPQFNLVTPERATHTKPVPKNATKLLVVEHLHTTYRKRDGGLHRAVDDVSFHIKQGETLGLVGESGCGKSSLSRTLLKLIPAASGNIHFDGTNLMPLTERQLKPWRKRIQMVFQDPYASLNPRRTVFDTLEAVLTLHGEKNTQQRHQKIAQILDRVGLPRTAAQRFPHEFSGGQRQRIGIARALITQPSLVILDEPVSALDVSIQAQILNLLAELKEDFGLSYLFISHDLSVVRYFADRVLVMHQGKIVEEGHHRQIWQAPQHAYTQTLIAAVPSLGIRAHTTQRTKAAA